MSFLMNRIDYLIDDKVVYQYDCLSLCHSGTIEAICPQYKAEASMVSFIFDINL